MTAPEYSFGKYSISFIFDQYLASSAQPKSLHCRTREVVFWLQLSMSEFQLWNRVSCAAKGPTASLPSQVPFPHHTLCPLLLIFKVKLAWNISITIHTQEALGAISKTGKEPTFQLEVMAMFILVASFPVDSSADPSLCPAFNIPEDMVQEQEDLFWRMASKILKKVQKYSVK